MNGERKAALALASLGDTDRAWMLERLAEPQRARVATLLDELREMRVPFDRELVKQLAPQPEAPHGLHAFDAQAVLGALEDEPDWLVALVLRARAWPWRAGLLQRLPAERRSRIGRALPHGLELGPKLVAAVLAAVDERAQKTDRTPAPSRSFWKKVATWRR